MNISDAGFQLETPIEFPADEVHLWRVELAPVAKGEQRWKEILSADERARAARFHFPRDRQYFMAARAVLRMILASYAASHPRKLVFGYSDKDKPFLSGGQTGSDIEFNISHSGDIALLAFARHRELGVDVEKVREDFEHETIARRFFSEEEQRQLAALAPEERYAGFFRCWTRKEAYIKAQGIGLSLPLHQFDVSLKPGDVNALLATRPDHSEAARWSLREVPAGDGYVAALCVRGDGWHLKS
jgi:4'-phosphopantetheinyl transferase